MPRKGTARIKKVDKYVYIDSSDDEGKDTSAINSPEQKFPIELQSDDEAALKERQRKDDPSGLKLPKLPSDPSTALQPRQDSSPTVEQSRSLANSFHPSLSIQDSFPVTQNPGSVEAIPRTRPTHRSTKSQSLLEKTATPRSQTSATGNADASSTKSTARPESTFVNDSHGHLAEPDPELEYPDTMIQGGAFIPPNQQRNMRACMVCSIVRTQQQFLTQGCPNCEHLLELAGNSDQINDCTSQVFEGLITVADTSKSWVARYQRLEGYVPGVYATQVEGILPDDILVAVENAGINYVPRDGSEQEMLGKD